MSNLPETSFIDWNVDRMIRWLREESLHDCVRPFSLKKINGISFLNLSDHDLKAFQISQESRRKLAKVLKRIKGKRRSAHRSFESESISEIAEPKRPSAIPVHVNYHDEDEIEGWGSDFDDFEEEDGHEENESDSDSGGEYIEPEEDGHFCSPESPTKEVPNIPTGLVAQLQAGLMETISRKTWNGPPAGYSHKQTPQLEVDDEIYDVLPDEEEEETYEQPSDDSGSGVVVRPMSHSKVIRCPSDMGEYIDARAPKYSDKEDSVSCPPPPPPGRPPKSAPKLIKPPPMRQPVQPVEQEIYEEVPEDEQPGCSQVIEEYEPWENSAAAPQDTYEAPNDGPQDTYEVPEPEQEQLTYEIPDPEPAPPARPPPRGSGQNPPKKMPFPDKGKPPSPSKQPVKQKPAGKPAPASKPQISPKPSPHISPKPSPQANSKPSPPNPASGNRSSRLYPNLSNTASIKVPSAKRPPSTVFPPPRQVISPPPPQPAPPARKEENNNEKKPVNEIPNTSPAPRLPTARRQPPPPQAEESPPPPPRPGPKPGQAMSRPTPLKPPRAGEHDILVGEPFVPTSPPRKSALPPLPTSLPPQPKSPVDPPKNSPWFHGSLDKKIAENALKSFSKEGAFIVRNSSKDPNNYSMSLFFKGSVRHLRMPRTNEKFVLGDSGKVQFSTIVELVDYYSQHKVDLKSGGSTSLTAACPVKK